VSWEISQFLGVWDVVDRGSVVVMDRSITWEARSMVSVDALLDEHEVAVRARVEELREAAARVAAQLGEAELGLEHVAITRATLAAVVAGSGARVEQGSDLPGPVPGEAGAGGGARLVPRWRVDLTEAALPAEYRRLWLAVCESGPVRAGALAGALGLERVPAKVEGVRYKLKRLVGRGWLAEREPGVFAAVPA
jgi:hypothetical protein